MGRGKHVVCLVGPTGAGKTASALAIAADRPVSVVNFDSRQVYREFPVITAQPDPEERAVCPHLLYGFLDTDQAINAAAFTDMARETIAEVHAQGRLPILVGGTGMYLKTLLFGIAPIPPIPEDVREAVLERVRLEGPQRLHRELEEIDPAYAGKIHPNDSQRNARAMEVWLGTGRTLSDWHGEQHNESEYDYLKVGLKVALDDLTPHLDRRIDIMLERGAVEEARAAWENCPDPEAPGWSGIGCAELLQHIRGAMSLDEARQKWLHNTRQYAKRQLTWFNREKDIEWFDPGEAEAVARRVSDWLSGSD
ncbi:tRNA (adenosine(37)-N6)-dimethylallyltransferase MiaA [Salidesulfovibrio brasiliensis]|uniref:tRNA (adenosine(37)-N6)-dimethylallyltransferase MiaA n=1 Tax=Salidesulfovibrio brasiliensis TaxID=221711 RepID=UPI0006D10A40|nr:tRNA (adenosine(37)-N6)-dimethylallyltransferase MiaA [Salidesulfovibrio brasiliensis]